jgi:hypothetical protein
MDFVQGEGRTQGTLFPVTLEELIPDDHVCRVIDAFVARLDMADLGFERAECGLFVLYSTGHFSITICASFSG